MQTTVEPQFKMIISVLAEISVSIPEDSAENGLLASIHLLSPASSMTEHSSLIFPFEDDKKMVVVEPEEETAANFEVNGGPDNQVTISVFPPQLKVRLGTSQVTITNFTFGGALDPNGTGTLNHGGHLNNIRIGATASAITPPHPSKGNYSGFVTFRLMYN